MEIKVERNGEAAATIVVAGCLDTAATAEFSRTMETAVSGVRQLVFDFSGLEFIASSALRLLVSLDKRLKAEGGDVVITGMNEVVRDVFDVTGLDGIFTIR